MSKLINLEPKKVFRYFEELCAIPHGSGNTKGASDYCMEFAKEHRLTAWQDEAWNAVIVKEASAGYEDAPTVILQGHLDMVCEKEADNPIDFAKDGLDLIVEGDLLSANGTTLGGDDGIAVAMALAILDDESIAHPRLECVFTTDEEIGLLGANAMDMSSLQGKRLINIDSELEGIFTVSCAGGMRSKCILPAAYEAVEGLSFRIAVEGLLGGHSGMEIHKERGNSNILMGRLLCELSRELDFRLGALDGGLMDNAIPRRTEAQIYIGGDKEKQLTEALRKWDAVYKKEYSSSDPEVTVSFEAEGRKKGKALKAESASKLLYLLHMVPNGVQRNSMEIPDLVQTSLNLGTLKLMEEEAYLVFSVRSAVETEKEALGSRLRHCVEFLGGTYEETGSYPGWEYKKDSVLRDTMVRIYEKLYGEKPQVEAIHAGLECGIFSGKLKGLDCVSIGPNMYDIHTPKERLSISSVKRVYEFVLEVLKELH
ncbi:aminoacyl-histidine dipeptidase [Candidatus Merdisoma sp. JLR.KK006]|uniref:aminoacyl-histidine dipeptidase n=1 Tax=Candidatus Merdisoma sp. JLR.KK006 TaxID=3112626 RepID=UPI002FEF820F